jgi:hypothetical protein
MLEFVKAGCKISTPQRSVEELSLDSEGKAAALFIRRYRLSVKKRLETLGKEPPQIDLDMLKSVGTAHGQIAAAIAAFRSRAEPSSKKPVVDQDVLTIAGHIIERECKEWVWKAALVRGLVKGEVNVAEKLDEAKVLSEDWVYCQ